MTKENRKASRRKLQLNAMIYRCDGTPLVGCQVQDISATGARLALAQATELPATFWLTLSRGGEVRRRCNLVWQNSIEIGAEFEAQPADAD